MSLRAILVGREVPFSLVAALFLLIHVIFLSSSNNLRFPTVSLLGIEPKYFFNSRQEDRSKASVLDKQLFVIYCDMIGLMDKKSDDFERQRVPLVCS